MLGIDVTRTARFEKANDQLVALILHPEEYSGYQASANQAAFLAARWAIKEALFKADNTLKPMAQLLLKQEAGKYYYPGYVISTSAEGEYYFAAVLKEQHAR